MTKAETDNTRNFYAQKRVLYSMKKKGTSFESL